MKQISILLERTERTLLVILFASLVGLTFTQIILRNLFDSGLVWADDAIKVLVLWIAMAGALFATRGAHHISIDVVTRFLTSVWEKRIKRVLFFLSGSVCGTASWYSYQFILLEYEDPTIAFLNVPTWLTEGVIPVVLGLMAIRFFGLVFCLPQEEQKNLSEKTTDSEAAQS